MRIQRMGENLPCRLKPKYTLTSPCKPQYHRAGLTKGPRQLIIYIVVPATSSGSDNQTQLTFAALCLLNRQSYSKV